MDCPLLLALDQFEDYLRLEEQRDEQSFDAELARCINQGDVKANVLISIREDELYRLNRMRGRIPNLLANTIRLEPLTLEQADRALRQPLERFNEIAPKPYRTTIAPGDDPIPTILAEAREEGDIEPAFLQLVMHRLWDEETTLLRSRQTPTRLLRLTSLNSPPLGGVKNIISTYIDRIMLELSEREGRIAAKLFAVLVTRKGERVALEESQLSEIASAPDADVRRVLEHLLGSGILKVLPPDRYEVTHDVVARSILSWRARFQEQDRLRIAIQRAAQEADERMKKRKLRLIALAVCAAFAAVVVLAVALRFSTLSARSAMSYYLAGQALFLVDRDPELSVRLSRFAIQRDETPFAWDSLQRTIDLSHAILTLTPGSLGETPPDVYAAAFSPDGQRIATSDDKGEIHIYDANSGKALLSIPVGSQVSDVAYSTSGNGRWLASASDDGIVRIWDTNDSKCIAEPPSGSRNGRKCVRELSGNSKQVWAVVFSPDGHLVASAGEDGKARIWEVNSQRPILTSERPILTLVPSGSTLLEMKAIAFSPRGDMLATAGFDKKVRLWSLSSGREIAAMEGHGDYVYGASFSPDGSRLATASWDGTAIIWNVVKRSIAKVILGRSDRLWGVQFSPDGTLLATTGRNGVARLWNVNTGDEVLAYPSNAPSLTGVAFSPDGKRLVAAGYAGFARVWDVPFTCIRPDDVGDVTPAANAKVTAIAFDSQGDHVAVSDSNEIVNIWDHSTRTLVHHLGPNLHLNEIRRVRFDTTGQFLVTASADHTAKVWSVGGQPFGPPLQHGDAVYDAVFNFQGTRIATAGWDKLVKVWRWPGLGEELPRLKVPKTMARVYTVAFSHDGKYLAAGGQDKDVWVWDLSERLTEPLAFQGLPSVVMALQFSPKDDFIAAGSATGVGRIWRFKDIGKDPGHELRDHDKAIVSMAFSSDGKLLATGSEDGDAVVTDLGTFEHVRTAYGHKGYVLALSFGSSSESLLTAGMDSIVADHSIGRSQMEREAKLKSRQMTLRECARFFAVPCPVLP